MSSDPKTARPPAQRWADMKARGNCTVSEIDAIDADTRWAPVEPRWWLEMMEARRAVTND